MGKFLPAYKDEKAHWIDGIHEPLVDEETFYTVQYILAGCKRRQNHPNKHLTVRQEVLYVEFCNAPHAGCLLQVQDQEARIKLCGTSIIIVGGL